MSCGQIALERIGIKVDTYYASEIKKSAIKVALENYPDIIHIGDVTKVKYNNGILYTENGEFNVGKIDLLIGGSPCFVEGAKVITSDGYKNIEDVKEGDLVLTHLNRFMKVLKTGNDYKETCFIKAQGMIETETTENHPYYIREMSRIWNNTNKVYERKLSDPKWVEVKDLKKGCFIGLPIPNIEENLYNLDEETCWLLGRYVADGHLRKTKRKERLDSYVYQVVFSIGSDKVEKFKEIVINHHFSCYHHTKSVYRCVISSMDLLNFIRDRGFGEGAMNKRIPQFILNLPGYLAKEFLDGYMSGDGYNNTKYNYYSATTVSKELALGLNLLIAKVYNVNSSINFCKREPTCIIEGRIVNQHDTYQVKFRKQMKKQSVAIIDNGYIWCPFNERIDTKTIKKVYNLEVEEDNSYTANNFIVHNCQNFSLLRTCGSREIDGLEGDKSKLFYEYLRILKEVNPTYFLLENVKMKKNSEKELNQYLGVEGMHINSSLVSFQSRPRIYWTNIPNVKIPDDRKINFQDYKDTDYEYCKQFKVNKTPSRTRMWNDGSGRISKSPSQCDNITYKNRIGCLTRKQDRCPNSGLIEFEDFCRYLTRREMELAQTIPIGYTNSVSINQAQDLLGDGWTVDIIAHILRNIPKIEYNITLGMPPNSN